jgi:16S rRNA (cytidine1402-2'-O)-methyltransferase
VFAGFLPSKPQERANAVTTIGAQARAVVLLEAPHRIHELAQALSTLGPRPVTVAREITKQFEQIATLPAQELTAWLDQDANRSRGEFALVVHPAEVVAQSGEGERVLKLLLPELPLKTAVKLAAEISGEPKNSLYDLALTLKNQS